MPQVIKRKPRYGLELSLDSDGVYRVTIDGAVQFESRVLAAAEIDFDERAHKSRRAYNQAWFERILVDHDGPGRVSVHPIRSEAVEAIKTAIVRPPTPRFAVWAAFRGHRTEWTRPRRVPRPFG